MVKAVIDVGSNSVLLLVAAKGSQGWDVLADHSAVTALGENTRTTGLLGEPGLSATLAKLRQFFDRARQMGADSITAAATMAVRIAKNRANFIERANAQATPVAVLSGEAEANFGYLSVTDDPLFKDEPILSIIDVGGHSTELATANRSAMGMGFRKSYPLGTLGLRETLLNEESATAPQILAACNAIDESIAMEYTKGAAGRTVALGATGTNLISIRDRLSHWDPNSVHGGVLSYEEIGKSVGGLSSLTDAERAKLPGIEPGRERTIHIGALILERFMHAIHVDECVVSARGWRYALLDRPLGPKDLFEP